MGLRPRLIVISLLLAALLAATPVTVPARAQRAVATSAGATGVVAAPVSAALAEMQPDGILTVIVRLRAGAGVGTAGPADTVAGLRAEAEASAAAVLPWLKAHQAEGRVTEFTPLWVINGFAVSATADAIAELAQLPQVERITADAVFDGPPEAPALGSQSLVAEHLTIIGAPNLWRLGVRGRGVVVASMDTGVYYTHPDLIRTWRGGGNSWYDPYGQHSEPADPNGHGTWVMGAMVAGRANGTAIGVAPEARWIAARIFDDRNQATSVGIHLAFQWLLDPDGNPGTRDEPDVVVSSWGYGDPGCNLEFQADVQALRAAGILPVFAAGNSGPNAGSGLSPANYPEVLSVGATDGASVMYTYSSRGPSVCAGAGVFPRLVAPGVNVLTTERYGLYTRATGTSLAAPQVAGAAALLLSAVPQLTPEQLEQALIATAVDLGLAGADNDFGYGRLDALAAYRLVHPGPPDTNYHAFLPTVSQLGPLAITRLYLPLLAAQS
ncbi:MAG: S8 family serine peptidase [Anaerolineae bacterium]